MNKKQTCIDGNTFEALLTAPLSGSEFRVFLFLSRAGEAKASDIAKGTGLTSSGMYKALRGLMAAGWVSSGKSVQSYTVCVQLETSSVQLDTPAETTAPLTYKRREEVTAQVRAEVAASYKVSGQAVDNLWKELEGYCDAGGKRYANYRAALQNWTRRALETGKVHPVKEEVAGVFSQEVENRPDEVTRSNYMAEIRKSLSAKFSL